MAKAGGVLRGLLDSLAVSVSLGLRGGVPLAAYGDALALRASSHPDGPAGISGARTRSWTTSSAGSICAGRTRTGSRSWTTPPTPDLTGDLRRVRGAGPHHGRGLKVAPGCRTTVSRRETASRANNWRLQSFFGAKPVSGMFALSSIDASPCPCLAARSTIRRSSPLRRPWNHMDLIAPGPRTSRLPTEPRLEGRPRFHGRAHAPNLHCNASMTAAGARRISPGAAHPTCGLSLQSPEETDRVPRGGALSGPALPPSRSSLDPGTALGLLSRPRPGRRRRRRRPPRREHRPDRRLGCRSSTRTHTAASSTRRPRARCGAPAFPTAAAQPAPAR